MKIFQCKRLVMIRRLACALAYVLAGGMAIPCCVAQDAGFANTLMPQPAHIVPATGQFRLQPNLQVTLDRFEDARLDQAIQRAFKEIRTTTGLAVQENPVRRGDGAGVVVTVDGPGEAVQSVDENESYTLEVTPESVHVRAATDVGAMRGLETLLQLIQSEGGRYFLPAVSIEDSPRFRWRGLMIDSSRHFESVDTLKRMLDGMAAVKMNVFHWHLSDDQGFRMESKVFPKLTGMGSNGEYYTQAQAREIVEYARERGIRVVPEFDMPGHSTSWMLGYPELASSPGPFHLETTSGIFDAVMDPTRKNTYRFLDKFFGEMATLFPDPYVHIGGDENKGKAWAENPHIQAFMRKKHLQDTAALQEYFNQKLVRILRKHHRRMVGWDEVLVPALPKDVVVQTWRGVDALAESVRQGHDGILSAGYYLDHADSAAKYYANDPIPPGSDLTASERERVLGGEACMWTESVTDATIDATIWPRTIAVAERLWSPQNVNDDTDMERRLQVESGRLKALGLKLTDNRGCAPGNACSTAQP